MGLSTFSTIDELLKAQAARPDDPVLVAYPVTDIDDFEEHTAKALDRYTEAAAAKYKSLGLKPVDPTSTETPVVALLAPSSFEVIVTILAVSRLGWALLFLSPRLVPAAHARLLQMCDCTTMIVAPVYQPTTPAISSSLSSSSSSPTNNPLTTLPLITRPDYRCTHPTTTTFPPTPPSVAALQSTKTAWIIHSSGSTGFPKPIPLSHRALLANFSKGLGLRAFCASPLFHSHGLMELFRCFYRGAPMYMANHARPVTRANLVRAMRVAKPGLVTAVPFVLGLLAEGEDGVRELGKAEVVMFAGSACPDEVGERLVRAGVRLVANYGSSETGAIMSSLRPSTDTAWSYLRMPPHIAPHILMDEISPGIFECVALESLPSRGPTNCSDPPNSYRTRDLFTRHPTNPSWWKYLTRLDDRLTLVNGEKVLPLPIEGRVRQNALVAEAVVFGAGRSVPGMLVFRDEEEGTAREVGEAEFVERIWGDVEEANKGAESFSRVPRELVVVMPRGTSWPRTDKGTAVRQQVYEVFKDVIDDAYARFEHGDDGEGDGEPLLALDVPELEQWLLERFQLDLGVKLESVDADVFAAGVDSLQTTRIWSLIRKKLELGGKQDALSQNVVYEKGTLRALAKHLYGLRTGEDVGQSDEEELLAMQELVNEFSTFRPHVPGTAPAPAGEVVLLTGATGGLGAHLLTTLLSRPDVQHIYALARAPDSTTAQSRILASLSSRGLEPSSSSSSSSALSKLTAVPSSDLSLPGLGLPADVLETLKDSLTCVIHAAWPVNFTLPVRAFRPHVAGLHNLLQLCLDVRTAKPAALYFASSVSAVGGMAGLANATTTTTTPSSGGAADQQAAAAAVVTVPEAVPQPLAAAQKMGYGRSKLVAEKVVEAAGQRTGLRARVLRIGQLVGDLYGVGDWNTTEAIPLLVRGVWSTGVLPALDESPSWLPIDVAAAAILDIALPEERESGGVDGEGGVVYHILNPQHFHWTRDFVPALRRTGLLPEFDVVSPEEWLAKLRDSDPDVEKNPSRKLLEFWEGKYGQRPGGKKILRHETKNTLEKAPRLGDVPLADVLKNGDWLERVVWRWINSW
ncbi:Non-canonical non-ribosomal peptide synthetase FUB8 [Lasiodiplodia theobromae]|uniref:Non-canonical non-ribosomal peptide synthetase FUB8 n=1 Tax=Lasiodiplodia theobromae TaxID=45133 RepID=A0A5N5D7F2_9PEZI|nr:Non-canonical non-ribosomal peptide synthetase FUB8 [Lasiodiplodia theobromae]